MMDGEYLLNEFTLVLELKGFTEERNRMILIVSTLILVIIVWVIFPLDPIPFPIYIVILVVLSQQSSFKTRVRGGRIAFGSPLVPHVYLPIYSIMKRMQ